jgi:uncharacterized protein (DUF488 family)
MEARPQILTVGHSTHPPERFLELLRSQGIEALADVRRYPASRRHPQFNREALARSLAGAGIEYVELGEQLGGRRRSSSPRRRSGWRNPSFAAYAEHMESEAFAGGLARLETLATSRRTAYMCAESDWRRCHRRLISDALRERGWRVIHLHPDGGLEPHGEGELG